MDKPKGGRGKRAEYETEMIRIPHPIKDKVLELKVMFYEGQLDAYEHKLVQNEKLAQEYQNLISTLKNEDSNSISSLEDTKKLAIELLSEKNPKKRSTKYVVAKLISSIYNVEVEPEEL